MWEQQTGLIEYVRKHTSQLVCACSEDTARDAVWARSPVRVITFKCFTHVGCGEGEPSGFASGPCQWHCIVLKAFVWEQDVGVCDKAGFLFVICD